MPRKKKGRNRQGSGAITDWVRDGRKVGRVGFIDLPRATGEKRKRKAFYGHSDEEVLAKMEEFKAQLKSGIAIDSSRQSLTQYLTRWLRDVAPLTVRPITIDSYERKLRVHVYPTIGSVQLTDLRPVRLSTLYSALLRAGKSKRTVQYVHAVLHKALHDAVRMRLIPYNPADNVDPPKPERKEVAVIPPEQIERVVEAIIDDWLYSLYYLAIATGCRRGELCALRWQDVDWERPAIQVVRSTQELRKDAGGIIYAQPKSYTSRRTVVLPTEAVEILRYQKRHQAEMRLKAGEQWVDTGFVFAGVKGSGLRPSTVSNHWKLIREKAGVPDIKLHGLRHTHATMLLKAGVQPKIVSERLGHSTIDISMNLYSHVVRTMQDEVADTIGGLMPKPRKVPREAEAD